MHTKTGQNRNEMMMISYDLMVSENSPVRLIDLMCRKFIADNPWREEWKGTSSKGCTSYAPGSMLALLVYGYFNKISSSRNLEKATQRNIEVMWLMEGLHPDHWTINSFRKNNEIMIKNFLKNLRSFLLDNEYACSKRMAFDGTKFKAYANRDMLTKEGISKKLENIDKSLAKYLNGLHINDTRDDDLESANKQIEELKGKISKLEKLKSKYEQVERHLELNDKNRVAWNDKDAILVKGRDGKFAGYNGQVGVETKGHFIMHNEIITEPNDSHQLENCVKKTEEGIGEKIEEVLADKGYATFARILNVEDQNIDCFVPLEQTIRDREEAKGLIFTYNKESNTYTCPQGKELAFHGNKKNGKSRYVRYKCNQCDGCPIRATCTTSNTGRTYMRHLREDEIEKYKEKLSTDYAKKRISERKGIVEHPFGTIKYLMGKFNFLLTGKEKVQIEFDLYTLAYNIKRLRNSATRPELKEQLMKYDWKMA